MVSHSHWTDLFQLQLAQAQLVCPTVLELRVKPAPLTPAIILWLVFAMLADIVITVTIWYGLMNSRTGWAHTDQVGAARRHRQRSLQPVAVRGIALEYIVP